MELNSLYRACSRVDKVGFRITKFQPKRNIFQQLREFHAEHEEMLVLDLEELMEETGCHPPCHYTEYSLPQTPIGKPAEKIDKKSMEIPISYRIVHFLSISGQRIGSFDEKEWKMTLVLTWNGNFNLFFIFCFLMASHSLQLHHVSKHHHSHLHPRQEDHNEDDRGLDVSLWVPRGRVWGRPRTISRLLFHEHLGGAGVCDTILY